VSKVLESVTVLMLLLLMMMMMMMMKNIIIICSLFEGELNRSDSVGLLSKVFNELEKNKKESSRVLICGSIPAFAWCS